MYNRSVYWAYTIYAHMFFRNIHVFINEMLTWFIIQYPQEI